MKFTFIGLRPKIEMLGAVPPFGGTRSDLRPKILAQDIQNDRKIKDLLYIDGRGADVGDAFIFTGHKGIYKSGRY